MNNKPILLENNLPKLFSRFSLNRNQFSQGVNWLALTSFWLLFSTEDYRFSQIDEMFGQTISKCTHIERCWIFLSIIMNFAHLESRGERRNYEKHKFCLYKSFWLHIILNFKNDTFGWWTPLTPMEDSFNINKWLIYFIFILFLAH